MRFWSQNLMADDYPDRWGGMWRHGRCKLHFERSEDQPGWPKSLGAEWALGWESATAVSFDASPSDREWTFHASIKRLFALWLHIEHPRLPMPATQHFEDRRLGISAHSGCVFWEVWKDPSSWSKEDGWRNDSFNWVDWLLGKSVHEREQLETVQVQIPLPERTYPAVVTLERATWRRPRGYFGIGRKVHRFANVEALPIPGQQGVPRIPYPGKHGGVSGMSSMSFPAASVAEAIGKVVEHVMKYREQRGRSTAWVPETL